jgi:type II secretory pathway component PulF
MKNISSSDFDRFLSEIASLSRAGIPLPEGINKFSQSISNGSLSDMSKKVAGRLEKGEKLSAALEKSGYKVSEDFLAMIQCAEISGDLKTGLNFLVQHFRQIKRHRSALITALFYPFLILISGSVIFWFAATYIIPACMQIYEGRMENLPLISKIYLSTAGLVQGSNGIIFFTLLALVFIVMGLSPTIRRFFWSIVMILPGFSNLASFSDTAITMKFLGKMLGFGVPIQTALRAVSLSVMTPSMKHQLQTMAAAAEKGHSLSGLLGPRTPATAAWLFAQAEERGSLPETCLGISEYCNERFELLSRRLVTIIEPIIIILVSILIGISIVGLYLPLFMIPRLVN